MKKLFQYQFEYNDWANELVIDALIESKLPPEGSVMLISHIILTQDIWLDRVIGKSEYTFSIWEEFSIFECKAMSKLSTDKWLDFLKRTSEKELRAPFKYENASGQEIKSTLEKGMAHIITHSAYHRGQINVMLRDINMNPPKTDIIFYPGE